MKIITDAVGAVWDAIMRLPAPVRLLIRDMIEGAAVALGSVQLFIPGDKQEAERLAITVAVAVGGAVLAVVRRAILNAVLNHLGGDNPPAGG